VIAISNALQIKLKIQSRTCDVLPWMHFPEKSNDCRKQDLVFSRWSCYIFS